MTIKKAYVELIELLEANKDKKISSILDQVLEIASSKKRPVTYRTDEQGNITHIFCWYHKEWEPVEWYGKKASSHTGYNTMCKQGVNQWTRQQKAASKAKELVLKDVETGVLPADQISEALAKIEEERNQIIPRSE